MSADGRTSPTGRYRLWQYTKAILATAGVLAWVAAPIMALFLLTLSSNEADLEPPEEVSAPIMASDSEISQPINLVLERSEAPALVSPQWTGLIEELLVGSPGALHSGDRLVRIGGLDRLAIASERPFTRSLALGDRGEDVLMLNEQLSLLGLPAGGSQTAGVQTVEGIRQLSTLIGANEPQSTFDPGWFVFMPSASLNIDEINLLVGSPAPASGELIVRGSPQLISATLVPAGTVSPAPADQTPSADEVGDGDEGTNDETAVGQLTPVAAPPEAQLRIGSQVLKIDESRSHVAATSLPALDALAGSDDFVEATIASPPRPGEWEVPPSTLISTGDNRVCAVRIRDGSSSSIEVTVTGGTTTKTIIVGDLAEGDHLLVAPHESTQLC